ncbi:MAG: hypothetical protein SVR94_19005 [Pseudomonadota bacterium]|nr:hypothetical protein [Pseudomonadota bacterium]
MIFKEDIKQRIETDFNEKSDEAFEILSNAVSETDYLKTDRVIRCIIFLANGDLDKLRKYIDNALFDTRDVMFWAEYEKPFKISKHKRVRDFNKTFENCTDNVKE